MDCISLYIAPLIQSPSISPKLGEEKTRKDGKTLR
jgi:hypothetical protein